MENFIEDILHTDVKISPYKYQDRLPLSIRGMFDFSEMKLGECTAIIVKPFEKESLVVLRKRHRQMEIFTGLPCVLYLMSMNYYEADRMVEEGIPFIWENHQLYLPFMGVALNKGNRRGIPVVGKISFLTQRMLLTSLYEGWRDISATDVAQKLDVSRMSVTRCFDEIEACRLPYLSISRRSRKFTAGTNKKEMWSEMRRFLRNPVIDRYQLKTVPSGVELILSGISAVSHYSLFGEEKIPSYAVKKSDFSKLGTLTDSMTCAEEEPACIIHKMGYAVNFPDGKAVDPLTVVLSLSDSELEDPRTGKAVDDMLEEYVW